MSFLIRKKDYMHRTTHPILHQAAKDLSRESSQLPNITPEYGGREIFPGLLGLSIPIPNRKCLHSV